MVAADLPIDSRARARRSPGRAYCLYCYGPMAEIRGASEPCPRCGEVNLKVDRREHWTLEPRLVRLEALLKALTVALALALAYPLLIFPSGGHGFAGVGFSMGAPLLIGFVLWDAASLVTARRSLLRHSVLWPLLPLTLVAGPALVIAGVGIAIGWPFWRALLVGLGLAVPSALLAALMRRLVRGLAARRSSYLAERTRV